ncbi:hypothetical protein AKJ50_00345 [candidate division MSBL1 archaeon SCGC-AAA382A13]|uniref:DNA topoisomerase type IA zn finger domain-containing protein n=1 Tax=candidate division MSBL1 archaeon SCGC-AAA382A13 TaxID=1698279 RepID=A0A133VGT8_9EURY|nr:hypothetical protein AKJ50_00345 [candidate division MSBL1 archaeon SCGC-AAA382A13]
MAKYDSFDKEAFERELPKGFKRVEVSGTGEFVYDKLLKGSLVIRVHSSVRTDNRLSRKPGSDAIRVSLYDRTTESIIKHKSRTRRIQDKKGASKWPENMRRKIGELEENYEEYVGRCPFCGALLREIGRNPPLYGCTNFPECRYIAEAGNKGGPIQEFVPERAKKAYDYLAERHDPQSCPLCSQDKDESIKFHDSLYHFLLKNKHLSDEQYSCIEGEVRQTA